MTSEEDLMGKAGGMDLSQYVPNSWPPPFFLLYKSPMKVQLDFVHYN